MSAKQKNLIETQNRSLILMSFVVIITIGVFGGIVLFSGNGDTDTSSIDSNGVVKDMEVFNK